MTRRTYTAALCEVTAPCGELSRELREMFMGDSSTPGTSLTAFRDLGLDIDRNGVMSLDETAVRRRH